MPPIISSVKNLFGDMAVEKVKKISLSTNTIKRRIDNIHDDIKEQLKEKL